MRPRTATAATGSPVTAEAGSRIVVREDGADIATATATGRSQQLSFRARDGAHQHTVSATDAAGNESGTPVRTRARGRRHAAGPARPRPTPATPAAVATTVRFSTDPGAAFEVRAAGHEPVRGTADPAGAATAALWLRSGRCRLEVTARDAAGNVAPDRDLAVAVARPALRVERTAEDGARPTSVVTGPARSAGPVAVGAATAPFTLGDTGRAAVTVPVADGRHPAVRTVLADAVGRRTSPRTTCSSRGSRPGPTNRRAPGTAGPAHRPAVPVG